MITAFTIIIIALLIVILSLVFLNFTFLTFTFPELSVFLVSMFMFFLLSRKLIFENAFIISFLSEINKGKSVNSKEVIDKMKGNPNMFTGWQIVSILAYWKSTVDGYRYTFYSLFALLLLLTFISRFIALQVPILPIFLESAVMGALIPVYFAWAFDWMASYYLSRASV